MPRPHTQQPMAKCAKQVAVLDKSIARVTGARFEELCQQRIVQYLGQGGQGSCRRMRGQGQDLVIKRSNPISFIEETNMLEKVAAVAGVQKLAFVCPE